jgi:hypothetical protein
VFRDTAIGITDMRMIWAVVTMKQDLFQDRPYRWICVKPGYFWWFSGQATLSAPSGPD